MLASMEVPGTVLGLGSLINGQRVQARDRDGFWFNGRIRPQHLEDDHTSMVASCALRCRAGRGRDGGVVQL